MKKIILIKLFIVVTVMMACSTPAEAQRATEDEALTVAHNWINLIINRYGSWGGYNEAEVVLIVEFKRGERILGYYCQVAPLGYIIVSRYKFLAPIKAYSETCHINPYRDEGLVDLIKDKMESIQEGVEEMTGVGIQQAQPIEVDRILEINYRSGWTILNDASFDSTLYQVQEDYQIRGGDYQEGEVLLQTSWHQKPPYNDDCPGGGCAWPTFGNFNTRKRVGCVATAGAQIMRYWCWPPYGQGIPWNDPYNWPHMHLRYVFDGVDWFNDENGIPVSQTDINAVAELGYEIGAVIGMDWGCSESSAVMNDMVEYAYEDHYRYDLNVDVQYRDDYSASNWYNLLKNEFNKNRPVQYRVKEHSIVGDGWRETSFDQYHMNYGWDDGNNAWWILDALNKGGIDEEWVLREIYPKTDLGTTLNGTYSKGSFPYRYFDRDASGTSATFDAGQNLQVLKPLLTITGNGDGVDVIKFNGASGQTTRFFLGYEDVSRIKIYDGAIKLYNGGQITFR